MSGHCQQHCYDKCQGGIVSEGETVWHISADGFAHWHPKVQCPACAERERVLNDLRELLARQRERNGTAFDRFRDGFDPDHALELIVEESYGDGQKAERDRISTNCMLAAVLADTHEEREAYLKLARFVRGEK